MLPYVSSRPSSTSNSKARLITPSDDIFVKKNLRTPLFKSPSWQNRKLSHQQDGTASTKPSTPTPIPVSNDQKQGEASENRRHKCEVEVGVKSIATDPKSIGFKIQPSHSSSESSDSGRNTSKARVKKAVLVSRNRLKDKPTTEVQPLKYRNHLAHEPLRASRKLSSDDHILRQRLKHFEEDQSSRVLSRHAPEHTSGKLNGAGRAPYKTNPRTRTSPEVENPSCSPSIKSQRTAFPKTGSVTHQVTLSRPTVVVEIDNSLHQSLEPSGSASRSLLDRFLQPLPRSNNTGTRGISVKTAKSNKEAQLLAELKKDTRVAIARASSVEEIIGNHGLSEHYDETPAIEERKSLAQLKSKKVKRSTVKLDWGKPKTASVFNPADIIPPKDQVKRLLDSKFESRSTGAPLTFSNDQNDRQIDGKFQFVDSYICRGYEKKTQIAPTDFGCVCSKQCDPEDTACRCFQTVKGQRVASYVREANGPIVLNPCYIDSISDTGQEIFECNDACNCSQGCFNRVVQKGRTIPLQIFMTKHCGFGIRSSQPIKKGQFIDVYLGELLPTKAIEEYENAITEKSSSYVFSLDYFGPASYHVQGLHFGSPTRFINHSCNPNTRTFTVMMNHADQKVYKLAYFAIRDIPPMKEITFDYSPETAHEEPWVPSPGEAEGSVVKCLCGEDNCRGRIWPKRQAARRKGRGWARI